MVTLSDGEPANKVLPCSWHQDLHSPVRMCSDLSKKRKSWKRLNGFRGNDNYEYDIPNHHHPHCHLKKEIILTLLRYVEAFHSHTIKGFLSAILLVYHKFKCGCEVGSIHLNFGVSSECYKLKLTMTLMITQKVVFSAKE